MHFLAVTALLELGEAWVAERDEPRSRTWPIHQNTPRQRFIGGESQDCFGDLFHSYQDVGGILVPSLFWSERIMVGFHFGACDPVWDEAVDANSFMLAQPGQRGGQPEDSSLGRVIPR
jgi:hypothetical protein